MGTRKSEDERLCSPCRRKVMACACIIPKDEYMEYPYPTQAEDTTPTDVSVPPLQETKVQYVITSDELDHELRSTDFETDFDEDDLPSVPNISMATVDSESDLILEDRLLQMFVMQSPEIMNLKRQLKEQRVQQQKELELVKQIEMEIREYNIKFKEFQLQITRMQLRKAFFKKMQGINT